MFLKSIIACICVCHASASPSSSPPLLLFSSPPLNLSTSSLTLSLFLVVNVRLTGRHLHLPLADLHGEPTDRTWEVVHGFRARLNHIERLLLARHVAFLWRGLLSVNEAEKRVFSRAFREKGHFGLGVSSRLDLVTGARQLNFKR